MIGIYKITNKINGKSYVGQSNNIKRRLKEHKSIMHETNKSLKLAYEKYGLENFKFDIIEECKLNELNEKEIYWIDKLKPEYNRTSGGDGSPNHTVNEETRKILKEKSKKHWDNLPEETKNKILKNLKRPEIGHSVSDETKEKLRLHNLGKKQSLKTIEKRKQTILEKKKNGYVQDNKNHNKKIICIETNQIFESVKQAGIHYNVTPSVISGVLKKRYKTCKGLHFEYYKNKCSVTTNPDECKDVG